MRNDYRPSFPAKLTPEEYAVLIAPDSSKRMLAAAAVATLALGGTLSAQRPSRENQVLELLQRIQPDLSRTNWYGSTKFVKHDNEFDSPVVVPHIPISFGNSYGGVFDAERVVQYTFTCEVQRAGQYRGAEGFGLAFTGIPLRLTYRSLEVTETAAA